MTESSFESPQEPTRKSEARRNPATQEPEINLSNLSIALQPRAGLIYKKICQIENSRNRNPTLAVTILAKILKRLDEGAGANKEQELGALTTGIEIAASQRLGMAYFLQATWDEQRAHHQLDIAAAVRQATFLEQVADSTGENSTALAVACDHWDLINTTAWGSKTQELALALFSVTTPGAERLFTYIPDRLSALIHRVRTAAELEPITDAIRHYRGHPEFLDESVNSYITVINGTADLPSGLRSKLFENMGEVIKEMAKITPEIAASVNPYNLLLCLSDAIGEPGRAAHLGEALELYLSTLRQGLAIAPRLFLSALALLASMDVHQQPAIALKIKIKLRSFRTSKELLAAALECGAHQNAEFVIRSGFEPSRHVTHMRECLTERAITDVTFRGRLAGLANLHYERSLQELDPAEISRLIAVARDLNYHHGFGAFAVEAAMPPGESKSLLHRFALDHGDAELINLAPPNFLPEYALRVSGLDPTRIFAAHGPKEDPFKTYKEAWPDFATILPVLNDWTFILSRRFLAAYKTDGLTLGSIWWNDHFPAANSTVAHTIEPQELKRLIDHASHHGMDSAVERLKREYALFERAMRTIFDLGPRSLAKVQDLDSHTRALDVFRIAYSQWKKGQTLPKHLPFDPSARPAAQQPGDSGSNELPVDSTRMLVEARRWHSLRADGVSNRARFPVLVVANTLDCWSEITPPISLDTFDMSLVRGRYDHGLLGAQRSRRSLRLWQEVVLNAAIDQPNALKELRFIFPNRTE